MKARKRSTLNKAMTRSLAALVVATCFGTAAADTDEPKYTMAVIEDAAHGTKVLSGKYDDAIGKIRTQSRRPIGRFYSATNLCVAYVKTGDLEKAKEACDSAVTEMQAMLDRGRNAESTYGRYLAVAFSNRGVLRAITGQKELARADFRDAIELEINLDAPATNMARLSKDASPIA